MAQTVDYRGGNGTILEQKTENGIITTIRLHIQSIFVSDETPEDYLVVRNEPDSSSRIILELPYNCYIDTEKVLSRDYIIEKRNETWIKIQYQKEKSGWICLGTENPYKNDNWSIIGTINASGRIWTLRKLRQGITFWNPTSVRDQPGLIGTKVIFTLYRTPDNPQINVDTIAVTEEIDTIEGISDCWVKIVDSEGRTGWVFSGPATIERGGPRYMTPENILTSYFAVP